MAFKSILIQSKNEIYLYSNEENEYMVTYGSVLSNTEWTNVLCAGSRESSSCQV